MKTFFILLWISITNSLFSQNFSWISPLERDIAPVNLISINDTVNHLISYNQKSGIIIANYFDKNANLIHTVNIAEKGKFLLGYDAQMGSDGNTYICGVKINDTDQNDICGFIIKLDYCSRILDFVETNVVSWAKQKHGSIDNIYKINNHLVFAMHYAASRRWEQNGYAFIEFKNKSMDSLIFKGNSFDLLSMNSRNILDSQYIFSGEISKHNYPSSNFAEYKTGYIEFDSSGNLKRDFTLDANDTTKNSIGQFAWKWNGKTIMGATDRYIGKKRTIPMATTLVIADEQKKQIVSQKVLTDTNFTEYFNYFTAMLWNNKVIAAQSRMHNEDIPNSTRTTSKLLAFNLDGEFLYSLQPCADSNKKIPGNFQVRKLDVDKQGNLLVTGLKVEANPIDGSQYMRTFYCMYDSAFKLILPNNNPRKIQCIKDTTYYLIPTKKFYFHADSIPRSPISHSSLSTGVWSYVLSSARYTSNKPTFFYPNPCDNILHFSKNKIDRKIEIYSMAGQKVGTYEIDANINFEIEIHQYVPGNYFIIEKTRNDITLNKAILIKY